MTAKLILIIGLSFSGSGLCATTLNLNPIHSTDSFTSLVQQVNSWNEAKNTLVVMDNDDTLTMISCPDNGNPDNCQYLGGAAWYSWQSGLLKSGAKMRVADNTHELIEASDLLFALNTMVFTRENVPSVLKALGDKGVRLMVETARGNQTISATEDQFTDLMVTEDINLHDYISTRSLHFNGLSSLASPYMSCDSGSSRSISYRSGVMYLAGQDKGRNLLCLLQHYNQDKTSEQDITHIVFIDDTLENVKSVHDALSQHPEYTFAAFHYTALASHKQALTKGELADTFQAKATQRWCNLITGMHNNLLQPSYARLCSKQK
ncbi:DUF2608 domain-containing protein [Pseudoalteromonas sp. SSDWG2]|uniref:DUF2608 domain-containing protein n=1 Tax=Pseudoalteromonas sp. SSDWG2 TaxID=3139391 RepID=UPI003BAAEE81